MAMPTSRKSVCCCEIDVVIAKKEENNNEISCIIDHEGFKSVCLNVWVLQTSYFNYRQQYGGDVADNMVFISCNNAS